MLRCCLVLFGALAAAGAAAAVPCFVNPLEGAHATVEGKAVDGPMSTEKCDTLQVQSGQVRVVFSDQDGASLTPLVGAGEHVDLSKASQESAPYTVVAEGLSPQQRRDAGAPGLPRKQFENTAGNAASRGSPSNEIYLPREGLRFAVTAAGAYQVVAMKSKKVIASGDASQPISLRRSDYMVGEQYQFLLPQLSTSSIFTISGPDIESAVSKALAQINEQAGLDKATKALAQALVYEQQSLSFNRALAVKELAP